MDQPDILDLEITALKQWLRSAWARLGDPSLTAYTRRELRNQMKQHSAELRSQLDAASRRRAMRAGDSNRGSSRNFSRPKLRILA